MLFGVHHVCQSQVPQFCRLPCQTESALDRAMVVESDQTKVLSPTELFAIDCNVPLVIWFQVPADNRRVGQLIEVAGIAQPVCFFRDTRLAGGLVGLVASNATELIASGQDFNIIVRVADSPGTD